MLRAWLSRWHVCLACCCLLGSRSQPTTCFTSRASTHITHFHHTHNVTHNVTQFNNRFGSFEVCKPSDNQTGRAGPSAGLPSNQLLLPLVGYVIKTQHPDMWAFYGGGDDVSMAGMAPSQVKRRGGCHSFGGWVKE